MIMMVMCFMAPQILLGQFTRLDCRHRANGSSQSRYQRFTASRPLIEVHVVDEDAHIGLSSVVGGKSLIFSFQRLTVRRDEVLKSRPISDLAQC